MLVDQDMASLKGIGIAKGSTVATAVQHWQREIIFVIGRSVLPIVRVFNDSLDGCLQVVSEIPSGPLNGIFKGVTAIACRQSPWSSS